MRTKLSHRSRGEMKVTNLVLTHSLYVILDDSINFILESSKRVPLGVGGP